LSQGTKRMITIKRRPSHADGDGAERVCDGAELKSKIRVGNIEFDGDISKDSPGSDLIKPLILDEQAGPLYLPALGRPQHRDNPSI
jgi:hypothetical protein